LKEDEAELVVVVVVDDDAAATARIVLVMTTLSESAGIRVDIYVWVNSIIF